MANPYAYTISGLKHVNLAGIKVRECPKCKHVLPIILRIAELHDVIAWSIVKEPRPLRGDEIRFLRKIAGFPAAKFARLLGITPQHLSRVENGHTEKLGRAADRLVRAFAVIAKNGERARELLLELADQPEQKRHVKTETPAFKLGPGGWKAAA